MNKIFASIVIALLAFTSSATAQEHNIRQGNQNSHVQIRGGCLTFTVTVNNLNDRIAFRNRNGHIVFYGSAYSFAYGNKCWMTRDVVYHSGGRISLRFDFYRPGLRGGRVVGVGDWDPIV